MENSTQNNIPRAAIHVGDNKKTFSAAESNEAERRGWDEKQYHQKNAEKDKNNHYDYSRKKLNFEIIKGGKIVPLGSNTIPLNKRLQHRLDELGFKPYMDKDHPNKIADNSPNCTVTVLFSGDHDVMQKLAFGEQKVDLDNKEADNSKVHLKQGIKDWAIDTYNFACRKWGEENIIAFDVHCDETSIHAHVQTVPVEKVKKRGRIGSVYVNNKDPSLQLTTKEWKKLPKEERINYTKKNADKDYVERVSYAKVWGEHADDKSRYLSDLHTDYHNEVGYKYGLERGLSYDELTEEEKRNRKHKDKVTLEAERQAKAAVAKAEKQKAEVEKSLETMKKYAILATIDKKGLSVPLLDVKRQIKEAELAIQKDINTDFHFYEVSDWRSNRITNINSLLENLVTEINSKQDKQNEEVLKSVDKLYAYYMQNLNKLIEQDKQKNEKIESLTKENTYLKDRLSKLDEDSVEQLTNKYNSLVDDYKDLIDKTEMLLKEPEIIDALEQVKNRRGRRKKIIDKFIEEGCHELMDFTKSSRTDFNDEEEASILYGIIANAIKNGLALNSRNEIESATTNFLDGISWENCSDFRKDCTYKWTVQFVAGETAFDEQIVSGFLKFIDTMSCSQDTYVSLMGSNGCAHQLSRWDNTKKRKDDLIPRKRKR